jgi:putative hemolysin
LGADGRIKAVILEVLIILLLILANGILSMSEIAIVSARKLRLQQKAGEGDSGAQAALGLANSPNRFLSTVQVGITLIGTLAGAFGGATLADELNLRLQAVPEVAPYSSALSIAFVVLAITYLTLILGELVPKRVALSDPERIAYLTARPMNSLSMVMAPVVFILSASTEIVIRALGIKPYVEPPVTEEEIRVLIDQGTHAGVFEEEEQDIVERVFRLGDRRVDALMTPRADVVWLDVSDSAEEVRSKIKDNAYSLFPVCKGSLDNVLGVVQAKDLLACNLKDKGLDLKSSLLPPLFVPESMRALKVLERFKQTGVHLAIIVDEYGGVQGLVTLTDLLEAIVGDIPHIDELGEPEKVQREDGSWLMDGMLPIDEFKDTFGLDRMPEEENGLYQTIGGFVMMCLERIPTVGDRFEWGGLKIEVVDMDDNRVDKLLVTPTGAVPSRGSGQKLEK